ncbi:MAG: nucleotidyltransferase domain-containing protein [ANME-2 cluster archaeon]|nr:nucleotidyltransferase domain-containing protein [ANME-2 cluster archaeon]
MMGNTYNLSTEQKEDVKKKLADILSFHEDVIFAYLLGSFLEKGSFHDVDMAVYTAKEIGKEDVLDYEISLSLELARAVNLAVDVKVIGYSSPGFNYEVIRGEVVFCRDDDTRFEFVEKVWAEYFDYKPVAEFILKEIIT